ncbi:translation initiation factor IF-2-like [Equus quagga]|uniref:translation initiation factor IF-2-like n=1 Tax=Equus quagga TaxID=89248 RepID=UPI001EE31068|nr:translation initiation factor IF-2-like [Equus quagga]
MVKPRTVVIMGLPRFCHFHNSSKFLLHGTCSLVSGANVIRGWSPTPGARGDAGLRLPWPGLRRRTAPRGGSEAPRGAGGPSAGPGTSGPAPPQQPAWTGRPRELGPDAGPGVGVRGGGRRRGPAGEPARVSGCAHLERGLPSRSALCYPLFCRVSAENERCAAPGDWSRRATVISCSSATPAFRGTSVCGSSCVTGRFLRTAQVQPAERGVGNHCDGLEVGGEQPLEPGASEGGGADRRGSLQGPCHLVLWVEGEFTGRFVCVLDHNLLISFLPASVYLKSNCSG